MKITFTNTSIVALLFFICTLNAEKSNAQEIRVVDNKGTLKVVNNNTVTTSVTAPANPVENDIWYDTTTAPSTTRVYDGTNWIILVATTDDQNASEVPLVTNIDIDGTPEDPSPILETTVEQAIQAIAPITSKAGRVFYPPSIAIDVSEISTTNESINLYTQYTAQYGASIPTNQRSTSAPDNIPVYTANELYYYVTYADPLVFNIIDVSDDGILTYQIIGIPESDNTLINVVFVVK